MRGPQELRSPPARLQECNGKLAPLQRATLVRNGLDSSPTGKQTYIPPLRTKPTRNPPCRALGATGYTSTSPRFGQLLGGAASRHRRLIFPGDAHWPDLQQVTHLGSSAKDGMRGKLKHALRLESNSRYAEGTKVFLGMNHPLVTVEENQIDREQHANGVHAVRGQNP